MNPLPAPTLVPAPVPHPYHVLTLTSHPSPLTLTLTPHPHPKVLLEERCFTHRKRFSFQPAECRGFEATDRYGRCCNAYLRTGAAQRVEGNGRCGGGRRVFTVRDPQYNGSGFNGHLGRHGHPHSLAPLPSSKLLRSGAAICSGCDAIDPHNDRPLVSGTAPVGYSYSINGPPCRTCPAAACE